MAPVQSVKEEELELHLSSVELVYTSIFIYMFVCIKIKHIALTGNWPLLFPFPFVRWQASEQGRPPEHTSKFYAKGALQYLVPILTQTLTKQVPPSAVNCTTVVNELAQGGVFIYSC